MRVAVAGGTGFVGRHIANALLSDGHEVIVVGRDPRKVEQMPRLRGAIARRGDVTQPETLTTALEGAEVVVSAVQFPNHPVEVPRRDLTYDRYDRRGTIALLEAATETGARRFVYISGAGADPTSEQSWYRAKGLAEHALRRGDLEHSILRPSWAYGDGDRALNRFILAAHLSPAMPVLGLADQYIQPVYADDIGRAVAELVRLDGATDRTFEIGCRDPLSMREVMTTLLEVMGKKRVIVRIPKIVAKLGTAPLVVLPAPPMTPQGIEFATQDGLVDIGPLVETLGFEPMDLRAGLTAYLAA